MAIYRSKAKDEKQPVITHLADRDKSTTSRLRIIPDVIVGKIGKHRRDE
jgi:hypothetical protein